MDEKNSWSRIACNVSNEPPANLNALITRVMNRENEFISNLPLDNMFIQQQRINMSRKEIIMYVLINALCTRK